MKIPDLTIVIPVHGRQWTLNRCLAYLDRFDGPVIVADSSPAPAPNIGKFPRVDYRHMPGMPYFQKLKTVYASVETPFLIDIPDDDFALLSGIAACCDHLRANPDVGLCGGHILVFKGSSQNVEIDMIHSGASLARQIELTRAGKPETVEDRLMRLFANPVDIVHAVMRREVALSPHVILDEHPELRAIFFFGRLWWFTAAIAGGISFLDTLLLLRAKDERLVKGANYPAELQRHIPHTEIAARLGPDGGAFTTHLMKHATLNFDDAKRIVARVLEYWMGARPRKKVERERLRTFPLAEAAAARQKADVARITELIRAYPATP